MKRVSMMLTAVASLFAMLAGEPAAAQWGDLTGKIVFEGTAPKMKPIKVTKDGPVCEKHAPVSEDFVVGADRGVANLVVYAIGSKTDVQKAVAPIHPDYAKSKGAKIKFDNKGCSFVPHVVALWTAQTLELGNSDPVPHNSFGQPFNNRPFNPLIPPGGSVAVKLEKAEKIPVKITCSIHPWMRGYVVVRPDPYAAVSAGDGTIAIKKLPAGEHTFQFWHESLGYVHTIYVDGKKLKNRRGQHAFTVSANGKGLGKIVIKASDYKAKLGAL